MEQVAVALWRIAVAYLLFVDFCLQNAVNPQFDTRFYCTADNRLVNRLAVLNSINHLKEDCNYDATRFS